MTVTRRIDGGLIVSVTAHAALLLWTAVSFAAKPLESHPTEAAVDVITASEFSQMMAGVKTAPKKEAPKPLVEKKAEPKPVEHQEAKISDKPEIVTASTPPAAEPATEPKKIPTPTPKPAPRVEPVKEEPRKEAAKPPEPKKDLVAEALKKDEHKEKKPEPKKEPPKETPKPVVKKPEPKPKVAEPKPEREQSHFDASQIAALLDKRQPRRLASAGEVMNPNPTLGTATGTAAQLSQNEIDALRARIQQCWNPPAGAADAKDLVVLVRIQFNKDGSLSTDPRIVSRASSSYQQVAGESALRAIRRCAPYTFLPAAKYDAWKDVEVTFDPRDLFRG